MSVLKILTICFGSAGALSGLFGAVLSWAASSTQNNIIMHPNMNVDYLHKLTVLASNQSLFASEASCVAAICVAISVLISSAE